MTAREVFFALVVMAGVGCATLALSQDQEPKASETLVKKARFAATLAGGTVTLQARIWIDLMPGPGSRPPPVRIAGKLLFLDQAHPGAVAVSRLWLVPSNEDPVEVPILSSQATQEGTRVTGAVRPSKDLPGRGWVVAEVKTPGGNLFIRSAETNIAKVH